MSSVVTYSWPVLDTVAIVNNVMLGAGIHTFTFNGTLSPAGGTVVLDGISRRISVTSAADLHLITFTITGSDYNGRSITETITGPNANTVYTTKNFAVIIIASVSADMTAAASIGVGDTGYTNWFTYDIFRGYPSLSLQAIRTATINYTFQVTLDNVPSIVNDSDINVFTPIAAMTAATTNQLATTVQPFRYVRFIINSSNSTGVLIATILQQAVN